MYKLLITGEKSKKLYWIENLEKQNLTDVTFTLDDKEADVDIIFGHEKDIFALSLDKYHNLKWIQLLSAGVSNPKNIKIAKQVILTTSKGIHGQAMFEYILHGLLHLNNIDFFENSRFISWERHRRKLTFTGNQTVLLVGCGNIGSYLAARFNSFGMDVHACVKNLRTIPNVLKVYENLKHINLQQYDLIISSLPFTTQTKCIFDAKFFSSLSSNAVFVNVGRGETVDECELAKSLSSGGIKGAILDAFCSEPIEINNFMLHEYSNCICTPHISGFFYQSHELFLKKFNTNFESFLKGKLMNESNGKY